MTKTKLGQLRRRIEALRSRPRGIQSRELEALAKALGRKRSNRGKDPAYISELLPRNPPVTIPHHSKPLKIGTAINILDQLDRDLNDLEEHFRK